MLTGEKQTSQKESMKVTQPTIKFIDVMLVNVL